MAHPWHSTIALALTGVLLELPETDEPDVDALVSQLEASGWDAGAIRAHALRCERDGIPWPHAVAADRRPDMSAAQWWAALRATREALGVFTLHTEAPSTRRELNADERRLLVDLPPHHVMR